MRRRRPPTVLAVAALAASVPLVGMLSPGSAWPLQAAWLLLSFAALIGTLFLAVAIVDDYDHAGMRGGSWGLAFLLSGGLIALLWAVDSRLPQRDAR